MSFHDVPFPVRLAFGASGGPERQVEIIRMASGFEQRNTRWSRARRRYSIATGIKSFAELHNLLNFFEDRGGPLHAFRFRDPVDHASTPPSTAIAATDRTIGLGDGSTVTFQLALSPERTITKPVAGSVRIAVDGTELEGADFAVDALTGLATLAVPPVDGAAVTAGFEFDVPVRFANTQLAVTQTAFDAGEIPDIELLEVFE